VQRLKPCIQLKTTRSIALALVCLSWFYTQAQKDSTLRCTKTITGNISPKSVVASTNGNVYAQNMMYRHTITVYDKDGNLVKTLYDTVHPARFGYNDSSEVLRGAPVEAGLNSTGTSVWITNYNMTGKGYNKPGCDDCAGKNKYDPSYVYRFNTTTYQKTACLKTGAVPKYISVSPNDKWVAVSNWTEGTVSLFSAETDELIKEIYVGTYPRGQTWSSNGLRLYVAVMGSTHVNEYSVPDMKLLRKIEVGIHPRHMCGPMGDSLLFVSLNGEGCVAAVSLETERVQKIFTGVMPRSMAISADGEFVYVVNYGDGTLSKISVTTRKKLETVHTREHPVGITVHPLTGQVWVACYSGFIQIFDDTEYNPSAIARKKQISEIDLGISLSSVADAFSGFLQLAADYTGPSEKIKKTNLSPVKNKTAVSSTSPVSPAQKGFYLVAGAFKSKQNASNLAKKLNEQHHHATLIPQEEKGLLYVAIGPFQTREEATTSAGETSKAIGENCWVYAY
jgi:YVTN family beta-propeller protein